MAEKSDKTDPARNGRSAKARREARYEALAQVRSFEDALSYAGEGRGSVPYSARFSDALAMLFANGLRRDFEGILPTEDGRRSESRARTAKGYKKLDVNYSTPELGLALGVSIKTISVRDPQTKRYTKNYSRNDNELRAEAMDYHQRQPYAVLAGVLFLPYDACDDGSDGTGDEVGVSSFGAAVKYFRNRGPRRTPHDAPDLFERFFVGMYEFEGPQRGRLDFYDAFRPRPPRSRRPGDGELLSFDGVLTEVRRTYDERNAPPFEWA